MKNLLLLSSFITLLFCSLAFMPGKIADNENKLNPGVYKIMEVSYLWDFLKGLYTPDKNADGTWLDVGFRSKYAMAKRYASVKTMEEVLGHKMFLDGPHGEHLDFNSTTSFGHYNPDFLKALQVALEDALKNPVYRTVLKQIYDEDLKSMADTYNAAYLHLKNKPGLLWDMKAKYKKEIKSSFDTNNGAMIEDFRAYADMLSKDTGANWYEAVTAPAFWVRRSMDGTDGEFFVLLNMVRETLGEE